MSDITQVLSAIGRSGGQVSAELLPLVYDELRHLAAHRLAGERNEHWLIVELGPKQADEAGPARGRI